MNLLKHEESIKRVIFFYNFAPQVEDASEEVKFPSIMLLEGDA